MSLRLTYRAAKGEFGEAMRELQRPIAEAATAALQEAAAIIKSEGRAEIARAGFSKRWQNALRADAYPRGGKVSIDAAAFIYHKVPYAEVFESGATIRGKPRLWLPLPGAPSRVARKRMTPERFRDRIGPLVFIDRGGRPPLLAARAALSRAEARKPKPKVSMAALRRGAAGRGSGRTVLRTVPLFVGLRSVEIGKKFAVRKVIDRAAGRLAALYVKHLKRGS